MNIKWYINEENIKVKKCAICKEEFPYTTEYFYPCGSPDKLGAYCKPCDNTKSRDRKKLHKKTNQNKSINNVFIINGVEYRRCSKCKEYFPNTFQYYDRSNHGQGGFRSDCRTCRGVYTRDFHTKRWAYALYKSAKKSAKVKGFDITIDEKYILNLYEYQDGKCYWLGVGMIPSNINKSPFQPSLDRLNKNLGYIDGNVVLCSFVANFGRNENSVESWKKFLLKLKQDIDYSQWTNYE